MTSDNLSALIARLEAAAGPDRELDVEIARLRGVTVWNRNAHDGSNYETTHWLYTASIDAALSLVPEGWRACVDTKPQPMAFVENCKATFADGLVESGWQKGATPALALCAAALKARTTAPTGEHTTT